MKRYALVAALLLGCDVEASLGEHDAGFDAPPAPACHAPHDAGACARCQAAMCCDAYRACADAPRCTCIVECVLAAHTLSECTSHCGGADHGEHSSLITCTTSHCAPSCP